MIHLNTERGLEKVNSWDDIESLAGFTKNLNPVKSNLKEIIGSYQFSEKVNCGLSNCRTPHFKGYVVVTSDGKVSNIGNHCGKKYFSVEFENQSRIFDRSVDEFNWRENINYFLASIDSTRAEFDRYFSDATDIEKRIRIFKSSLGIPNPVHKFLENCFRQRDGKIYIERRLTEEERDVEIARSGRSKPLQVVKEIVSEINGFDCLKPDFDIKAAFVENLKIGLDGIVLLNTDALQYKELRHWASWCSSYKENWKKALNILDEHKTFLKRSNLKNLKLIQGLKEKEIEILENIINKSGIK